MTTISAHGTSVDMDLIAIALRTAHLDDTSIVIEGLDSDDPIDFYICLGDYATIALDDRAGRHQFMVAVCVGDDGDLKEVARGLFFGAAVVVAVTQLVATLIEQAFECAIPEEEEPEFARCAECGREMMPGSVRCQLCEDDLIQQRHIRELRERAESGEITEQEAGELAFHDEQLEQAIRESDFAYDVARERR